jgi:DNA replication licensing factor MCM4
VAGRREFEEYVRQQRRQQRANERAEQGFEDAADELEKRGKGEEEEEEEEEAFDYPEHLDPDRDATFVREDEEPFYIQLVRNALENAPAGGARYAPKVDVAINVKHLTLKEARGESGLKLQKHLIKYPGHIIPLFDIVLSDVAKDLRAREQQGGGDSQSQAGLPSIIPVVRTRVYNLPTKQLMRLLDPGDIDKLISLHGMVVRATAIIPNMHSAFYRCANCPGSVEVEVEGGRVEDPSVCADCGQKGTMELVHNRCTYTDKQQVKLQEAPDDVPEGETPSQVKLFVYEEMVDTVVPGDRVVVTGIFRALPRRVNPRLRTLHSIFETVVDVVHFSKANKDKLAAMDAGGEASAGGGSRSGSSSSSSSGGGGDYRPSLALSSSVEKLEDVRDRVERMKAEACGGAEVEEGLDEEESGKRVYSALVASLAPSIWELDDVKRGVLLQLFGGVHKDLGPEGRIRGEIHVLLCGDPGTSKSQMLSFVHRMAPRGMYTSGTGSSAVGLTANVRKDPDNRNEFVLESGALVLSDRGICCIDEFDKMDDRSRSIMHEAMEQQTVSVAKAGIVATLNARTSVLASANPSESRYNPALSVVENIQLPPALLSRFDLIYLVLDAINPAADRALARHIVSLFFTAEDRAKSVHIAPPPFSRPQLMEYISYAKANLEPILSNAACEALVRGYVTMRGGNNPGGAGVGPAGRKTIAATTRQLESLVRLSEAHARMRLSTTVEEFDVLEAVRLMDVSTQKAAVDPRTGTIDMNLISTGHSVAQGDAVARLVLALKELLGSRAPRDKLSLGEVIKILHSAEPDMPEPARPDLMAALRELAEEDDPILTLGSGKDSVIITGNGLRMQASDY